MNGYRSATTGSLALTLLAMSLSAGAASPNTQPVSPSTSGHASDPVQTNDQARKLDPQ
jgi:hypothetical protein